MTLKNKYKNLKKIKKPAVISFLGYLADVQGCGTIRVIYPYLLLNHYRERRPDGPVSAYSTFLNKYVFDVNFYQGHTIVQFQRSATKYHLNIFKHFKSEVQKKYRIPLVYEIDDQLIGIPEWNYASNYYKKNEPYVKKLLEISDGIITSTLRLKQDYLKYNENIEIIPNHLPKFMWGDIYNATEYKNENEKIKILWAGSQNHFSVKDITEVQGEGDFGKGLIDFIKKTTDIYEWHLMGGFPVELEGIKNKIKFHPWKSIFQYPQYMKSIEPDICIAPLKKNKFNECKSNIKHLEYVACGAPGVYTNIEPYKNATLKANNDEEMIALIEKLANDINFRNRVFNKDYQKVKDILFWEENNNIKRYINTYLKMFGEKI